jgi:hypothetical protein
VDIRYVEVNRVAAYVSKYFAKDFFMRVPRGMRRFSCSRDIHLFPRKEQTEWKVLRASLKAVRDRLRDDITELRTLPGGELLAFTGPPCLTRLPDPGITRAKPGANPACNPAKTRVQTGDTGRV